jgi:hypothetical protein
VLLLGAGWAGAAAALLFCAGDCAGVALLPADVLSLSALPDDAPLLLFLFCLLLLVLLPAV